MLSQPTNVIGSLESLFSRVMFLVVLGFSTLYSVQSVAEQTRAVLIDTRTKTSTSDAYQEPAQPKSSQMTDQQNGMRDPKTGQMLPPKPQPPIIVRVTGYGLYDADKKKGKKGAPAERLLAMRASRLDAYRNLAERVYGFSVTGGSKVKDFALQHDEFAARVDTVVRGARVVSISENPETGIETVLELELPADFKRCLNRVNNFRYRADCLRPITNANLESQAALANQAQRGAQDNRMRTLYYLK